MSTNLTPAERTRIALERAERAAFVADWKEYRALEDRYRDERFPPKRMTHGVTGYVYHKCRCQTCRDAWNGYMRERNRKIRALLPPKPKPKGREGRVIKAEHHGKTTGYAYGCRCRPCKDAHNKSKKRFNHGTEATYNHRKCRCRKCTDAATEARRNRERRAKNIALSSPVQRPIKVPHGTENRYNQFGCRCRPCKDAHNESVRERRARRKRYYQENPDRIPTKAHGTENGYATYCCRCRECKDAHAEYTRKRRAK